MAMTAVAAVCIACAAGTPAMAAPAEGVAGPAGLAQVQAQLGADAAEAERQLTRQRAGLAQAATTQRRATASRARAQQRVRQVRVIAAPVEPIWPQLGAFLEAPAARDAGRAARAEQVASTRLVRLTRAASDVQAAALDADRRLDALARAVRTEDEVDADLGSYRFGSGGAPVSAASIDRYLESKASPMAGNGAAFLAAGLEFEVDPRLVVAIAGAESYFGVQRCAPFNAWGWGCPNSPYSFGSWADGIRTISKGIRTGYLDDGLDTVAEMHLRYAPPAAANDPTGLNLAWPTNVSSYLAEQGGDPGSVAGRARASR